MLNVLGKQILQYNKTNTNGLHKYQKPLVYEQMLILLATKVKLIAHKHHCWHNPTLLEGKSFQKKQTLKVKIYKTSLTLPNYFSSEDIFHKQTNT